MSNKCIKCGIIDAKICATCSISDTVGKIGFTMPSTSLTSMNHVFTCKFCDLIIFIPPPCKRCMDEYEKIKLKLCCPVCDIDNDSETEIK